MQFYKLNYYNICLLLKVYHPFEDDLLNYNNYRYYFKQLWVDNNQNNNCENIN